MKDLIVAEVRRHRLKHTRKCHGDLRDICADLAAVQRASGHKVVRLKAKRLSSKPVAALSH